MDDQHEQAIRTLAAERYMLGQMTDAERESFEEHYFNCRFCVEDVKAIDLMGRAVEQSKRQPVPPPSRWSPMTVAPWAVAATLAGALALQMVQTVPVTQVAQTAPVAPVAPLAVIPYVSDVVLKPVSRGVTADATKLPANVNIAQYVEIAQDPQYKAYDWNLRGAKARSLASGTVTPDQTNEPILLLLGPLPAGSYELVIEGVRKDGNRSTITIYPLVVGGT